MLFLLPNQMGKSSLLQQTSSNYNYSVSGSASTSGNSTTNSTNNNISNNNLRHNHHYRTSSTGTSATTAPSTANGGGGSTSTVKMKVTVCFGNVRVIVPCHPNMLVRDLIHQASLRYKKATGKVSFSLFFVSMS